MVWVSGHAGQPTRPRRRMAGVPGTSAARCTRYAVECGDTAFSAPLKRLLLRAIAIGRRRDTLKDITLKYYLADLDPPAQPHHGGGSAGRSGTQTTSTSPQTGRTCSCSSPIRTCPIPTTSPSAISRPSVIFRKVTNGFRCEWGAETYAAFRSLVSTAKRPTALRCSMFCASVLAANIPEQLPAQTGVSNYRESCRSFVAKVLPSIAT